MLDFATGFYWSSLKLQFTVCVCGKYSVMETLLSLTRWLSQSAVNHSSIQHMLQQEKYRRISSEHNLIVCA